MKMEQLQHLIEISRTGSFSQAARNLYISQPNLSHSVKQIETELGHPVFERTPSGIMTTEFGKNIISYAATLQKQYEDFQYYCEHVSRKPGISLRIASLNLNSATPAFLELIKEYTGDSTHFSYLHFLSLDQIIEQISTFQADLAVIGIISPFQKSSLVKLSNHLMEYHPLMKTGIAAIVGKQHPLYETEADAILLEDILNQRIIFCGDSASDPSFSMPMALGIYNRASSHIRVNSLSMFYKILEQTAAVGLLTCNLDMVGKSHTEGRELRLLPIKDTSIHGEIGWIKLQQFRLPEPAYAFLEKLKELYGSE